MPTVGSASIRCGCMMINTVLYPISNFQSSKNILTRVLRFRMSIRRSPRGPFWEWATSTLTVALFTCSNCDTYAFKTANEHTIAFSVRIAPDFSKLRDTVGYQLSYILSWTMVKQLDCDVPKANYT